jgi:hypothetical protein
MFNGADAAVWHRLHGVVSRFAPPSRNALTYNAARTRYGVGGTPRWSVARPGRLAADRTLAAVARSTASTTAAAAARRRRTRLGEKQARVLD